MKSSSNIWVTLAGAVLVVIAALYFLTGQDVSYSPGAPSPNGVDQAQ
jgi:LPXTG-motif cell wall-anchored protein